MTKNQFKKRWESNDSGGGINFDDVAECAKAWGISSFPRTSRMDVVLYKVLLGAKTVDAENFKPED